MLDVLQLGRENSEAEGVAVVLITASGGSSPSAAKRASVADEGCCRLGALVEMLLHVGVA